MSALNLFLKSGHVQAPLANGVGRFIPQCQRITIKFCKNNGNSRGVREFIENDLVDFARNNPNVVTYLKPRRNRGPVLVAEYLNGHREWMSLARYTREDVIKYVTLFQTAGGQGEFKYKQYHRTDHPSIQGVWTPFTHTAPEKNIVVFPSEEYSSVRNREKSATEVLLEIQKGVVPHGFIPPPDPEALTFVKK